MAEVLSEQYGGPMNAGPEYGGDMSAGREYGENHDECLAGHGDGEATNPFDYINHNNEPSWGKMNGQELMEARILDGSETAHINSFFERNPVIFQKHDSQSTGLGMHDSQAFDNGLNQETSAGNYTFTHSGDGTQLPTTASGQDWMNLPIRAGTFHDGLSELAHVPGVNFDLAGKETSGLYSEAVKSLVNLKASNSDLQAIHTTHDGMWQGMTATYPAPLGDGSYLAGPSTRLDNEAIAREVLETLSGQAVGPQYPGVNSQAPSTLYGMPNGGRVQSVDGNIAGSVPYFDNAIGQSVSPAVRQLQRMPLPRFGSDPNISGSGFDYQAAGYPAMMQQTKSHNLMQVPLADRAAVSGQMFDQPRHMGQDSQRIFHMGRDYYDNSSLQNGGLPTIGTSSMAHQGRAFQWGTMTDHDAQPTQAMQDEVTPIDSSTRKRRRSKQMQRDDEDDDYLPEPVHTRDAKVQHGTGNSDEDVERLNTSANTKAKRRKSVPKTLTNNGNSPASPADTQSPTGEGATSKRHGSNGRKNLSQEQKRQNHIMSEQKRRNVIKAAFTELERLVPALKEGKSGLSKAEQMREIAAYLKSVKDGNEAVRGMLEQAHGGEEDAGEEAADYDNDDGGVAVTNGHGGQGGFGGYGNFQAYNHLRS